jgi:nitrogen fixation/metabolism regulation signal transduction histidine kinase
LLAVFGALSAAVLLSAWLAGPLRSLERATKAVAGGDYPQLKEDVADHELNDLLKSFNDMTRQLQEAKQLAFESQQKREASMQFLEQVLSHLSAGVMVFDQHWQLRQFNPGASRIIGEDLRARIGQPLGQLPLFAGVAADIEQALLDEAEDQRQIEAQQATGQLVSLVANTSRLPTLVEGQPSSHVLVFDDISALLSAQRAKTWSDMARRLAHEIKNPLTPIQLSAERLQRRLTGKLEVTDQELLEKSCDTIVDQVAGLKAMVDEFRNYARLPMAQPEALELGGLVAEIMTLYATDSRVQAHLSDAACWVWADRGQLIQVIHNLVQNAQDAVADQTHGMVTLTTLIRPMEMGGSEVVLRVDDNGPGIPPEMMGRIFEPYVTSKAKGSGLGLAIVKKIAEENRARISLETRRDADQNALGARAELSFAQWLAKAENLTHG